MEARNLPPELCTRIALHSRQSELLNLARTAKALQEAAESRLYSTMYMRDPTIALRACSSILAGGARRGSYVYRFWFYLDSRRSRHLVLSDHCWQALRASLAVMPNLEDLCIHDPTLTN